jgi:predicted 2-oxoglutarate/Fe(II)-dependent dioxygenase YbiX/peroxiredoxin
MGNSSTQSPATYVRLLPGDAAPWFKQRSTSNPNYAFESLGGLYVVMCFFGTTDVPMARGALRAAARTHRQLFDDVKACFFGISVDRRDELDRRAKENLPGIRMFWDFDASVSRMYGAAPIDQGNSSEVQLRPFWLVLDPTLRVMATFAFEDEAHTAVFDYLSKLPPPELFAGFEIPPPVLVLPNVFDAALCKQLIGLYEANGGEESGFMRDVGGKTVLLQDHAHKRRRDFTIEDAELIQHIHGRLKRTVIPEILKVYSFKVTRVERTIVSCYAANEGGHFRPHRDNTTKGTVHRRLAVSINLNSDFEGGELGFPEYGRRRFKAPAGGAVVFPGALLHAVSPVTQGRRYAFLPFLYDEEAARIREENAKFLEGEASSYKADSGKSASAG